MKSAIITAFAVIFIVYYLKNKKKKVKIPECYHCESKDTLTYNTKRDTFHCTFCERVLDTKYISSNYPDDYYQLTKDNNKTGYEAFKKARKESVNIEKSGIASNDNIKG